MFFVHETNMHTGVRLEYSYGSETRVLVASEPVQRVHCIIREFGHQPPPTVRAVCAGTPSLGKGQTTRKRENVTVIGRETGSGAAGDPIVCHLEDISSPSRLCTASQWAGHRPSGSLGLVRLVPCRYLGPVSSSSSHVVDSVSAVAVSAFLVASLSHSSRARMDCVHGDSE